MATRLYGEANVSPAISPAFDPAPWASTTGAVRRRMRIAAAPFNGKQAATETRSAVAVTSGAGNETLGFQLVSDPLDVAQTITGTVTIVTRGRELATTDNIQARVRSIRVFDSTNTLRGTLLAFGNHSVTTELGTSLAGYLAASATALSSVAAQAGDYIVVEIGYGMTTTGTSPQYDMVIGGNGTDHTTTDADTTGTVPWIEFSQNLTFAFPLEVQNVAQAQVETTIPLGVDLVVQNVTQAQKASNVLGPGINPPSWTSQTLVQSSSLSGVVDISGAPDGDWVYAFTVIAASQTGNISAGAAGEWTQLVEGNQSTATHYALHRRKKQAGDTTFTFSWDTTQKATILLSSWPGPDSTTPEDTVSGSNVQLHSSASGNYPTPSVTPAGTGRWAVVWAWLRSTAASPGSLDWTADAALVERNDQSTSSSRWVSVQLSDSNGVVTQAAHSYTPTNADTAESNGGAVLIYLTPPTTGTDLVVGNVTQAQVEANLALTQVHNLTVQNVTQAQTEQNLSLTQVHVLALQSPVQSQPTQNITLDQSTNLVVNPASQAQVETNLTLTQVHVLTMQNVAQAQLAPQIPMGPTLVVGNATQAQVEQNLALTQVHVLTVQGVVQAQVETTISLAGATTLVVQNAVQAQPVSNVVLVRIFNLVVQNQVQAQSSTSPTLVYNIFLALQAAVTGQLPVNVVLTQLHQLVVQGAISPQLLAMVVLSTGALPLVRVGDGRLIQRYGGGQVLNQDQDHGKTLERFGGGALSRQGDGEVRTR